MSEILKISVALTGEQISALKSAVDAGEYATTSEVVREAVRDWQRKQKLPPDEVIRLRHLWDEGKASGKPKPFNVERTIAAAKVRLKKANAKRRRGK